MQGLVSLKHILRIAGALLALGTISSDGYASLTQSASPSPLAAKANKTPSTPQASSVEKRAQLLGWTPEAHHFCQGYYLEPAIITATPSPTPLDENTTAITADGPTLFVSNGRSILQKNVVVTQPGRLLKADTAYLYRDAKQKRITHIELVGNVRFQQKDKLIISQHATLYLPGGKVQFDDNLYHLFYAGKNGKPLNAWGTAQGARRHTGGIIDLSGHATYTTCPPINPSWQIQASSLRLDHKKGVGVAKNIVLVFHHVPIFFSPYYSFPLNHERKSGFLTPIIGYSGNAGWDISTPIYWNMAPNYDSTITPRLISQRGAQLNLLTRLLTQHSQMNLFGNYLPGDKLFRSFKNQVLDTYPIDGNNAPALNTTYPNSVPSNAPYIQALLKNSDARWFAALHDHTDFSPEWQANVDLNRVSDDYYLADFDLMANGAVANQLLNQANLHYQSEHWEFLGLAQGYQTLHPINQSATQDQYQRLPELDLDADYPGLTPHVDLAIPTSLVNFGYVSDFQPGLPTGQRLHTRPNLSFPFIWASGYLTPALSIDNADYVIRHPMPGQNNSLARTLPIVDLNTGLYFDRSVEWGHAHFLQTLEPELFYLFVPYKNQDNIPNYDTYLLPFSFSQLFTVNQFTGFDRLQNANQVSLGLTSRFINSQDGSEKLKLSIGSIYYLTRPRVCLTPNCTPTTNNLSPVVGEATLYPARHWSFSSSWAWDPNLKNTNNGSMSLTYTRDSSHLFTMGYNFVNAIDNPQYSNLTAGFYWPLASHWGAMGYTYYNISAHHPDSFYYGLQYNSCCWSLRFVSEQNFLGTEIGANSNQYKSAYYVQLALNGLGTVGNKNTDELLLNTLPGYNPELK